jgi:hypothetical protein
LAKFCIFSNVKEKEAQRLARACANPRLERNIESDIDVAGGNVAAIVDESSQRRVKLR